MRIPRCLFFASLVLGMGLLFGCGGEPTAMRNMQAGTGPEVQRDINLKKTKREMPPEPPSPMPPK